jgi:hypothetical protein
MRHKGIKKNQKNKFLNDFFYKSYLYAKTTIINYNEDAQEERN